MNARVATTDPAIRTAELAGLCVSDPVLWADVAWQWGQGDLYKSTGPYDWQINSCLAIIRDHLNSPNWNEPLQIAIASGHGVGKTALFGIVSNWAMSTMRDCRVVMTANTADQMRTKTSPEVAKWFKRSITADWFKTETFSIKARDARYHDSWRMDFATWTANNTEAFQGLHNHRKRIVVLLDEASGIDDHVWEVIEGALTDEDTEIIWIVFSNPTRNVGRFRECFRRFRHRWHHFNIDARDVPGTNKSLYAKWASDYGEDSDFFKVRVRGMFPAASAKQFISTDLVDAAFGRHLRKEQYQFAPIIIGVDPAWTGDDAFEIVMRQGMASWLLGTYAKNDNDWDMAMIIAKFEEEYSADAVNVDAGFGTGIVSAGRTMNRSWNLIWFSGKSPDPMYLNLRAYMWARMRQWLMEGGAIPPNDELYQDLIGPELIIKMDGKHGLESKDDMKERGIPSPNKGDALALTHVFDVPKLDRKPSDYQSDVVEVDYDPFKL